MKPGETAATAANAVEFPTADAPAVGSMRTGRDIDAPVSGLKVPRSSARMLSMAEGQTRTQQHTWPKPG